MCLKKSMMLVLEKWLSMSITNIAHSRKFSSDRTIQEYPSEIRGIRQRLNGEFFWVILRSLYKNPGLNISLDFLYCKALLSKFYIIHFEFYILRKYHTLCFWIEIECFAFEMPLIIFSNKKLHTIFFNYMRLFF